jgi:hypothetical protein
MTGSKGLRGQKIVKRLIFIAFLFLLFILMSVRSYDPAYTDPPASLKSLLRLNHPSSFKLPDIQVPPSDSPAITGNPE